ncbi:holo-[acyl-carrier protein] synthase [Desulfohalotomaculum tongense]|uniref:holo-ACP synthase n=1 Tax=Desulforadius tongensis TaxID=1216062 RepID=UPI0019583140|nr:holo-ACP synthase [Desulforadius tongensis]MBM7854883.1 holo-[acyl-carrier protein] synthase [Desulforadius tongensis]
MLTGIGTDIIEIQRVADAAANPRFLERVYTAGERDYCMRRKNPYPCLAARFAAKEAVLKALGTGLAGCRFTDVEVLPEFVGGPPAVKLYGGALKAAEKQGIQQVLISISHDGGRALAFAAAVKGRDDT